MPASQTKQAFWMVVGYFLLIVPCLAHAWEPCLSTINPFGRAPRVISRWINPWLNTIYGNREDGVSGAEALIWPNPAQPGGGPRRRARALHARQGQAKVATAVAMGGAACVVLVGVA